MATKRIFTYEEALDTFPRVRDLTAEAVREVEKLVGGLEESDEPASRSGREEVEEAVNAVVRSWAEEVQALGCEVKGLWLVDWDSGDGYYCWRHPEESIAFFHDYDAGFAGRMPIN